MSLTTIVTASKISIQALVSPKKKTATVVMNLTTVRVSTKTLSTKKTLLRIGMKMKLNVVILTIGLTNLRVTTKVAKMMMASVMVRVLALTLTVPSTMVAGKMAKDTAMVHFLSLMEPVLKETGKMIRKLVKVNCS